MLQTLKSNIKLSKLLMKYFLSSVDGQKHYE